MTLYEECKENVVNFEFYCKEMNFQTGLTTFSILIVTIALEQIALEGTGKRHE